MELAGKTSAMNYQEAVGQPRICFFYCLANSKRPFRNKSRSSVHGKQTPVTGARSFSARDGLSVIHSLAQCEAVQREHRLLGCGHLGREEMTVKIRPLEETLTNGHFLEATDLH